MEIVYIRNFSKIFKQKIYDFIFEKDLNEYPDVIRKIRGKKLNLLKD